MKFDKYTTQELKFIISNFGDLKRELKNVIQKIFLLKLGILFIQNWIMIISYSKLRKLIKEITM